MVRIMEPNPLPIHQMRIKEELDYCDSSNDWNENTPCDKLLKIEILEPETADSKHLMCRECDALFVNDHELKIHKMIHSTDHTCFMCKEFVKNRFQFVGHVRKHMCARPFKCPTCERTFPSSRETKLHLRVHSDDRPYMCTECGKAFKQISTLKDHEVVHTGEKKFKCKIEADFKRLHPAKELHLLNQWHLFWEKLLVFKRTEINNARDPILQDLLSSLEEVDLTEESKVVLQLAALPRILPPRGRKKDGKNHWKFSNTESVDGILVHATICEGAFATATSLRRHIRVMHETVRAFLCHFCKESFTSQQARKQHMAIHKDIDPLKCNVCGEKLPNLEEFTAHRNRHIDQKSSGICEYCGNKTFYFGLKEHIEKIHQPRSCDICSLVFYDEKSMDNHRKSHLEESVKEEFICQVCGKVFEFPRYLKAHMKRHDDDYKKFKCDLCLKQFSSKRDLKDHLNVHANVKNYICKICNKAFRTQQSVNKHMPIHSEKRPFKCILCDKRFKKQSILRKHSFTHSRNRPFGCDLCEKTYKSKESLRVHKLTHHQRKKKRCRICKNSFNFESVYKNHGCFSRYKFDITKRRCNVCKRFCKTAVTYVYHLKGHLKQKLFECDICKEPLRNQYQVKLHDIAHRNDKDI